MPFDFKKEFKELYSPKNVPEILHVPCMNYVAVQGSGDPNKEGGSYQQAIGVLYAISYTIKMSYKVNYKIKDFFEYVVPPLEGFWWQNGVKGVNYTDKSAFNWISVIRLDSLLAIEEPVAGRTRRHAHSEILLLVGQSEIAGRCSSGDYDCVGLDFTSVGKCQAKRTR